MPVAPRQAFLGASGTYSPGSETVLVVNVQPFVGLIRMVAHRRVEGCDLHGVNDTERAGETRWSFDSALLLRVRASRRWMHCTRRDSRHVTDR
mgnify:CR=1 FL=1